MRKYFYLIAFMAFLLSCNNIEKKQRIKDVGLTLHYFNSAAKDTMMIKITKVSKIDGYNCFSRVYNIPIKSANKPIYIFVRTFKDIVYYNSELGIFRLVNDKMVFYTHNTIGHFKDFLWLPQYIFEEFDTEGSFLTYNDRYLNEKLFNTGDYAGALDAFNVKYIRKRYSTTYSDTIRTIGFFSSRSILGRTEYKSYDSKYNMVRYQYVIPGKDTLSFELLPEDYKKLKKYHKRLPFIGGKRK